MSGRRHFCRKAILCIPVHGRAASDASKHIQPCSYDNTTSLDAGICFLRNKSTPGRKPLVQGMACPVLWLEPTRMYPAFLCSSQLPAAPDLKVVSIPLCRERNTSLPKNSLSVVLKLGFQELLIFLLSIPMGNTQGSKHTDMEEYPRVPCWWGWLSAPLA